MSELTPEMLAKIEAHMKALEPESDEADNTASEAASAQARTALTIDYDKLKDSNALDQLKQAQVWSVCYKGEKFPHMSLADRNAKTNDPSTWSGFDDAVKCIESGRGETLCVAADGKGVVYLDIDGCRNPESGEIVTKAGQDAMELFSGTYIEASPSGTGLRIIAATTDETLKNINLTVPNPHAKHSAREIYGNKHFVRISGYALNDSAIADMTPQLIEFAQSLTLDSMALRKRDEAKKAGNSVPWAGHEDDFRKWAEDNRGIFEAQGLVIRGDEWVCRSPLRDDDEHPSFCMNVRKGIYNDFGRSGGTFTDLADKLGVAPPDFHPVASDECSASKGDSETADDADEWKDIWDCAAPISEDDDLLWLDEMGIDAVGLKMDIRMFGGELVFPLKSAVNGALLGIVVSGVEVSSPYGSSDGAFWACGDIANPNSVIVICLENKTACALAHATCNDGGFVFVACVGYDNARIVAREMRKHHPSSRICAAFAYSDDDGEAYKKLVSGDKPAKRGSGKSQNSDAAQVIEPVPDAIDMCVPEVVQGIATDEGCRWCDLVKAFAFDMDILKQEWLEQYKVECRLAEVMKAIKASNSKKTRRMRRHIKKYSVIARGNYVPKVWPVDDIIAPGVMMLSAKPKEGKTYLMFQLANAVAGNSSEFLGHLVHQMPVMYVALEDDEESTKHRQELLVDRGLPISGNIDFMYIDVQLSVETDDFKDLLRWMIRHEGAPSLVIIDTLTLATPERKKDMQDAYQAAVRFIHPLEVAVEMCRGTVIFTTHNKKNATGDIQEKMTGSMGNSGTAAGTLSLSTLDYKAGIAKLEIVARRGGRNTIFLKMLKPGFAKHDIQDADQIAELLKPADNGGNTKASRAEKREEEMDAICEVLDSNPKRIFTRQELWKALAHIHITKSTLDNRMRDLVDEGRAVELPKQGHEVRYQSAEGYCADDAVEVNDDGEQTTLLNEADDERDSDSNDDGEHVDSSTASDDSLEGNSDGSYDF